MAVELDAGELSQLAPLFESLKVALERVCADELGRTSLADRVQRIHLRIDTPGVSLSSGQLVISGPLAPDRMRKELDAVL